MNDQCHIVDTKEVELHIKKTLTYTPLGDFKVPIVDDKSVLPTTIIDFKFKKISNVKWENIDHNDCPDYCDAYIVSADYDGEPMDRDQIELLNDDDDLRYDLLMDYLN